MSRFRKKMKSPFCHVAAAILIAIGFSHSLLAYGPLGHEIVGAIADELLANTGTGQKVHALLDGVPSLERAAVIADVIKGWDTNGPNDIGSFHYSIWPEIDSQLIEFWKANQPTQDRNSATPSHHWFHYTDVPIVPLQQYNAGRVGRSKWDIVHMIPYCVDVLKGRVPENNDRKITKPIAIILLAHYVGDIHQPLHVGAAYFDARGQVTDPEKDKSALVDEGGNTFTLKLIKEARSGRGARRKTFHGFWDYDAVNDLFPTVPERLPKNERQDQIEPLKRRLVREMTVSEPKNWRVSQGISIDNYAEAWANEMLPIAREAHERLSFRKVSALQEENRVVAAGEAVEKPDPNHLKYRAWADNVVREELHKAGWRLADLLEQALK